MSWGINYKVEDGDISESEQDRLVEIGTSLSEDALQQFTTAVLVVAGIIDDGLVGNSTGQFQVSISGHANKDHKPTPGWANDMITISVSQVGE